GRVAIFGGGDARVEIYDPASGQFTVQGTLLADRVDPTVILLPNSKVMVVGGDRREVEVYDPATGISSQVGSTVHQYLGAAAAARARTKSSATLARLTRVLHESGAGAWLIRRPRRPAGSFVRMPARTIV